MVSAALNVVRVALDVPVAKLFDYRAGDATREDVGRRVVVPLGRKTAVGVILEAAHGSALAPEKLKAGHGVLRDGPGWSRADLELLKFAADYYHHPLGAVVVGALPARLRRPPVKERPRTAAGPGVEQPGAAAPSLTPEQAVAAAAM